ncbi:GxxExxY protein [Pedobacter paludis]|uniref:GxxExxY protein n=1 Tax=Pedobacter paludis TaxID=2203212 RepID=A0A317F5N4_9SPHI|nr:GxxExxY protein [Pedobacter paludis]PWS33663.1 GxxExxY protein [Pedobacter paludis]
MKFSYIIRGSVFRVYNTLGPGLLESGYEAALKYELEKSELYVQNQVALTMVYENIRVDVGCRLDLVLERKVIIELKSTEMILNVHHKQLLTYLKLSGIKLGLLVNFKTDNIANSIYREAYGLRDY